MPLAIGNNIKTARVNAGLTQQALADSLKMHRVTIANYERESRKPSLETLIEISKVLNCSLDGLCNRRNNE